MWNDETNQEGLSLRSICDINTNCAPLEKTKQKQNKCNCDLGAAKHNIWVAWTRWFNDKINIRLCLMCLAAYKIMNFGVCNAFCNIMFNCVKGTVIPWKQFGLLTYLTNDQHPDCFLCWVPFKKNHCGDWHSCQLRNKFMKTKWTPDVDFWNVSQRRDAHWNVS